MKKSILGVLLVLGWLPLIGCSESGSFRIVFDSTSEVLIEPMAYSETMVLPEPEREGYAFLGWFVDEGLETPFRVEDYADIRSRADVTVYAGWQVRLYSVSYLIQEEVQGTLPLHIGETVARESAGHYHSAVLTSEGRLFLWGRNSYGQLGDGTSVQKNTPTEITDRFGLHPGERIVEVSLGNFHSSALTSEGRLFLWGRNDCGQLGNGTMTDLKVPTEITEYFELSPGEVLSGVTLGLDHSSACTSEGRFFTWGHNYSGQLGDGTTDDKTLPTEITDSFGLHENETIDQVSLGDYHSSVLTSEGRFFIWGRNASGQLGDGTLSDQTSPMEMTARLGLHDDETVLEMSLGDHHTSVLTSEGRLLVWGRNNHGQIGNGTAIDQTVPTDITGAFGLDSGETVLHVFLGSMFSCALTSEGCLFTWGQNSHGRLGDGTTEDRSIPTEITDGLGLFSDETPVDFNLGGYHSFVLTSQGRLFLWGWNQYGEIGDGTTDDRPTPASILSSSWSVISETEVAFQETVPDYLPSREGRSFGGWYSDGLFRTSFVPGPMTSEDVSVFGYWIPE